MRVGTHFSAVFPPSPVQARDGLMKMRQNAVDKSEQMVYTVDMLNPVKAEMVFENVPTFRQGRGLMRFIFSRRGAFFG